MWDGQMARPVSEDSGGEVWFPMSYNLIVYIFTVYSNQSFDSGVLLPD